MEILIFHYNKRQDEGIFWMVIARGCIFYVGSWRSESPIESRQLIEEMICHPYYMDGKTPLPRFYLKTTGEVEINGLTATIRPPSSKA